MIKINIIFTDGTQIRKEPYNGVVDNMDDIDEVMASILPYIKVKEKVLGMKFKNIQFVENTREKIETRAFN